MPKQASKTEGKTAPPEDSPRWHLMDADGAILGAVSNPVRPAPVR